MSAFDTAIVKAIRSMPDEAILDLVKAHLGMGGPVSVGAPQGLEAIPRKGRKATVAKPAKPARKGPGLAKAGRAKPTKAAPAPKAKSGGEKRTPEALASQAKDLIEAISKNHGLSAEQLAKETGLSTKAMRLPMKKLIDDGKVQPMGQKRSTKYYPK